ncbi:MAG: site-2 protease family protein [Anaerolineaceae bacterium]|nr:site-2 protease family protein [Anaerolineaceae bacterium]
MENTGQSVILDHLVERFFIIDSMTFGSKGKEAYIVRYSGRLRDEDSSAAYQALSEQLKPHHLMPLFRKEKGEQVILLVDSLPVVRPSNPWINVVLFALTLASVLLTGALYSATSTPTDMSIPGILAWLLTGWPFAVSLMLILTAHEFGHYLVGRFHNAQVSPPYFIPFPFSYFGTMGAFINMKEPPKNRRILLDIGLAGPLAGLLVAIPVLLIGLSLSQVGPLTVPTASGMITNLEGNSVLYLLSKFLVFHQWLPSPASFGGLPPIVYYVQYFFTGRPLPIGGLDVILHPIAWAGWAGLLVTALNLIPAGQLDGGHMLYVLLGTQKARRTLPFILLVLVLLGFVWNGWWLWAALIFFLVGRSYAEPLDQITPLNPARKAMALLALIIFLLVFTPVPLQSLGG